MDLPASQDSVLFSKHFALFNSVPFALSGPVLRSEDPILSSQCCRLDGLLCCILRSLTNRVGLLPKGQPLMPFRREAAQINRNMPDMSCFGHYTACNRRCSRLR